MNCLLATIVLGASSDRHLYPCHPCPYLCHHGLYHLDSALAKIPLEADQVVEDIQQLVVRIQEAGHIQVEPWHSQAAALRSQAEVVRIQVAAVHIRSKDLGAGSLPERSQHPAVGRRPRGQVVGRNLLVVGRTLRNGPRVGLAAVLGVAGRLEEVDTLPREVAGSLVGD